jgi:trehalose 6-phosphate synthase
MSSRNGSRPDTETLILVSNREPYEHIRGADGAVRIRRPAGGLVSALDPTMQHLRGTWVAWGSGSADREHADDEGRLAVPPEDPRYTLRRVWLDEADVAQYYLGFANSVLWPLCHGLSQHVQFREHEWRRYGDVNARFAAAVLDEAERCERDPVVWVQDYHFALLPALLRARAPHLFVHQFWHIPFPSPTLLRELHPAVRDQLLRGLLGNDLLEFQTNRDVENFLACVETSLPSASVQSTHEVTLEDGRRVEVRAFPISIDVERYEWLARSPDSERRVRRLRERYLRRGRELGVCVDRVDYTKGIPERLRALDLLWTRWPELHGRFSFIVVATPSRTELDVYRNLEEEMLEQVASINRRHGTRDWTPIVLINDNVDASLLSVIYRAADVCIVSSLQDGMNLVAKEFIACQVEERGALILSRFAGAAERIDGAVLFDPHDAEEFAEGIRRTFEMPVAERRARMRRMRAALRQSTIYHWLDDLNEAVRVLRRTRVHEREAPLPVVPERRRAERRRPLPRPREEVFAR